jgi:predicted outer membrane repeat protein
LKIDLTERIMTMTPTLQLLKEPRHFPGKFRKMAGALVLLLALLVSFRPSPTFAATTTTITLNRCTETDLRLAISKAQYGDTIKFGCSGSITITGSYINIDKSLTLDGAGQQVILSGGSTAQLFFVSGYYTATFNNLNMRNGNSDGGAGGAITAQANSTVNINNVNFSDNTSYVGGAIYNQGAVVNINGSTFSGNSAAFEGGSIYSDGAGTLNINNTTFSGNTANISSGALFNDAGNVTITNSTFTNNASRQDSGAISNQNGTVKIDYSTFTANSGIFGGGIFNAKQMTITNSTFTGNSATTYSGGAVQNSYYASLEVANSTFANNSASMSGGAIYNVGTLTVTNSTLANNSSQQAGGGISNGFVYLPNYVFVKGSAKLVNTILANNGSGGNCGGGSFTDGDYNLESANSCGLSKTSHSLVNSDPKFATSSPISNGGSVQTLALQPASPAIAAGNPLVCQGALVSGKDARGLSRPTGYCDIGAYDSFGVPAPVTVKSPTTTILTLSTSSAVRGSQVQMRVTVTKSLNTPVTGKVVFKEGNVILAEVTPDSNGLAAAVYDTTNKTRLTTHNLQAQFVGDDTYAPSTSTVVSLFVS